MKSYFIMTFYVYAGTYAIDLSEFFCHFNLLLIFTEAFCMNSVFLKTRDVSYN